MGHIRKPNESDIDFANRRVLETGQLWAPNNQDGPNVKPADLKKLKPTDSAAREGIRGLQRMMVREYATEFAKVNGTTPDFDGKLDAATLAVMETPRCDVPDYRPPPGAEFLFEDPQVQEVAKRMQVSPAIAGGNWPRCHGQTNFHCCVIQVDMSNRPSWATDAVMVQVWRNVQSAYAAVGQYVIYVGMDMRDLITGEDRSGQHVDTVASWASSSSGWIGLAILTLGLDCVQKIWQQYLKTYQGGTTDALRIRQNTKLWMHEHGHNSGLDHNNGGGIMYPSIQNDERITWIGDQSQSKLVSLYGPEPFILPGPGPGPVPPPPTDPIAARLKALEDKQAEDNITNMLQNVRDQLFDARIKKLEARVP